MNNLEKYINKYRNIVDGPIEQKVGYPVWNKELPYNYYSHSDKIDTAIENEKATLQIIVNYPDEKIVEVHNYALIFTGFVGPVCCGAKADRRNVCGTYIKTIDYTSKSDQIDGDESVVTYTETVSGDFRSLFFDYNNRWTKNNYQNTNLVGKNISFINETFVSISDENAKWRSIHDHPDYNIYFTRSNCQVNFFTDKKNVSKYKDHPGYNNKPSDEFTLVWADGNREGVAMDRSVLLNMRRTGEYTVELVVNDIDLFYDHDRDSTIVLEFEPGSNKATGRALDFDVKKESKSYQSPITVTVYPIDSNKQIRDINDIDFNNLQDYTFYGTSNLDQDGNRVLPPPTWCGSFDIVPGFIFDDRYI